jgi:hypothetical protein
MAIIKGNWRFGINDYSASEYASVLGFISKSGKAGNNAAPTIETGTNKGPVSKLSEITSGHVEFVIGTGYYSNFYINEINLRLHVDGLVILDGNNQNILMKGTPFVRGNGTCIIQNYNLFRFDRSDPGALRDCIVLNTRFFVSNTTDSGSINTIFILSRCLTANINFDSCIFFDSELTAGHYKNCVFVNCVNMSLQSADNCLFFNCTDTNGNNSIGTNPVILSEDPFPYAEFFDFTPSSASENLVLSRLPNNLFCKKSSLLKRFYTQGPSSSDTLRMVNAVNSHPTISASSSGELSIPSGNDYLEIGTEANPIQLEFKQAVGKISSIGFFDAAGLDILRKDSSSDVNPAHLTYEMKYRAKDNIPWSTLPWLKFRFDVQPTVNLDQNGVIVKSNGEDGFDYNSEVRIVAKELLIRLWIKDQYVETAIL